MIRHLLRVFQGAFTFQIIGDAGGAQAVITNVGFNSRLARPPLDHAKGVRLGHAVRRTRGEPASYLQVTY